LSLVAPPLATAAVIVVVLLSFSGCLHMDGLADTADGLLSSRPRERILEIMKDSHTGAMGVIAIACVLLLKFASLASLPADRLWPVVLLMPLAGRCAIVVHRALLPYARPSGLGNIFYRRPARLAAIWAVAVLAAVAWCVLGSRGLIVWAVCMAMTLACSAYVYRKIGGATGDTFGAVCEIIEIVPALTLAMGTLSGVK
jgi:adenosylcobinamide-GDP ribazoletransferase